ncbi:mitogen-activated protein kinase kinase kinase 1 [Prunus persica]|uniref:mitogen-activated protein kinase kinase kinase 1 n=1 Tax=Prunus persica TaxID=3760 RepID=UPI0009AB6662|nr:mitogen-activated protein kinase kinase kinase 1 [Prunus persica]
MKMVEGDRATEDDGLREGRPTQEEMNVSHGSVHPVEDVPTTDGAVPHPLRVRMKDLPGMPGTHGGLALRLSQLLFSAADLGLKYLHDRRVIHRDIKCANILVHANGSVKLADFGLAKTIQMNNIKSSQGTAYWMAPEVVNRKHQGYGLLADIWSLGCTVLEMLTRRFPYPNLEWIQALFNRQKKSDFDRQRQL